MHARRKVRACMAGGPLNFSPVKPAAIYLFDCQSRGRHVLAQRMREVVLERGGF